MAGFCETSRTKGGKPYYYFYRTATRKKSPSLTIGVEADTPVWFSVTTERATDDVAKAVGMSVEAQSGDSSFDEEFYIECNSHLFAQSFFADPAVRDAIRAIFATGLNCCASERHMLQATWNGKKGESFHNASSQDFQDGVVNRLNFLGEALPAHTTPEVRSECEQNDLLLSLATWGTVFVGVLALICFLIFKNKYPVISMSQAFKTSCWVSLPAAVLSSLATVFILWGQSRCHRRVVWLVPALVLSFLALGYQLTKGTNGMLDRASPQTYSTTLSGKRDHRGKRGSHTYYLEFAPWRAGVEEFEIVVPYSQYHSHNPGDRMEITTSPGRWGLEWLRNYRKLP